MFVGGVRPCLPDAHKSDAAPGSALGAATQKQLGAQRLLLVLKSPKSGSPPGQGRWSQGTGARSRGVQDPMSIHIRVQTGKASLVQSC